MNSSLLAVFVALLCATAVTGAPSTPNLSIEELTLSESFGFADKLRDYWLKIKCIREILAQETSSEVKALWAEYKAKLVQLHEQEWNKCKELSNIVEQERCKAAVIEKSIGIYSEFFSKLVKIADLEKAIKIGYKIADKCFGAEEFAAESLPDQFQCMIDVVGDVSKSNGLEDLWSKNQPQMQQHIDSWRGCAKVENKFAKILCNIKEGYFSYHLFSEYLRTAAAQKPLIVMQIVRGVQEKCNSYRETDEDIFDLDGIDVTDMGKSIVDKLKCISNAITDGLKETDFETPWNSFKKDLEQFAGRIAACKGSNFWETAKCIAKEAESAKGSLERFLKDLEYANKEAFERVKKYIKQRCQ